MAFSVGASEVARAGGRAGGGQPGPRSLCAVPEAWARGVCGAGRTGARGGRQAREGRRSSAPARPPHGPAAPGPPGARAARPALLVPGVQLLRAVRLRPPAQTFVEHRQGTGADLPPGGPGTPARVPQRPLSGYPLLRADQGEGRRAPGARGGSLTRAWAVGAAGFKGAGLILPKCFPATGTLPGGPQGRQGGQGWGFYRDSIYVCPLSPYRVCGVGAGGRLFLCGISLTGGSSPPAEATQKILPPFPTARRSRLLSPFLPFRARISCRTTLLAMSCCLRFVQVF